MPRPEVPLTSESRRSFFHSAGDDDQLESRSGPFWESLSDKIAADVGTSAPASILDVGCHRGGLLALLARRFRPERLAGIEPIPAARLRAEVRLRGVASSLSLFEHRGSAGGSHFDLVTCHEVLYLEPDLPGFFSFLEQALTPSGRAYIVLGCHTENPVWPAWRQELTELGHQLYDYSPMDLVRAGAEAGLVCAVRPLRDGGWSYCDAQGGPFAFPSINAFLDHQFRHKLLFRFHRMT